MMGFLLGRSLFTELQRRNVLRMAGLYLVGAWLVVQVSSTVLPMFGAPDWLPRSIVIVHEGPSPSPKQQARIFLA